MLILKNRILTAQKISECNFPCLCHAGCLCIPAGVFCVGMSNQSRKRKRCSSVLSVIHSIVEEIENIRLKNHGALRRGRSTKRTDKTTCGSEISGALFKK